MLSKEEIRMLAELELKMESKHYYFVSYTFTNGNGNWAVFTDEPIKSMDDVRKIEALLNKETGHKDCTLNSWKLFDETDEEIVSNLPKTVQEAYAEFEKTDRFHHTKMDYGTFDYIWNLAIENSGQN